MMDDEDDATYHPNPYAINPQKFPIENSYVDKDDDDDNDEEDEEKAIDNEEVEEEEEDDDDDDGVGNGVQRIGKDYYEDGDEDNDHSDSERQPKKRKLKALFSNYEFAPRVPPPSSSSTPPSKSSYGGRNPLTDWTERETFILLDSWGERFIKQGRKSLRSEEWQEVSKKVSKDSKLERTDTQCRNRLDTLKKKYKKEKMKCGGPASEWVYFKKMDALLSLGPQQGGLSCGVNSGEFVFMNPKVGLNGSNGLNEMRGILVNSQSEDESEGVHPKRGTFEMLADSFRKFSDIYEKVESSKREQMMELEKMRMDFHRDLEVQKREIVERAQAKIARIRQGDYEDNNVSADNLSG